MRRVYSLEEDPIMKVNQVMINPNENSNRTYAIGYENGLIRIKTVGLMKKPYKQKKKKSI